MDSDASVEGRCSARYERPGGRERGDRIVKCHLNAGHSGEHEEADTEITWIDEPAKTMPKVVRIELVKLQALFDLAVGSMDFGSGFWDTEETLIAREIAVLLGVDPMEATPSTFRKQFPHAWKDPDRPPNTHCYWCQIRREDHPGISDSTKEKTG